MTNVQIMLMYAYISLCMPTFDYLNYISQENEQVLSLSPQTLEKTNDTTQLSIYWFLALIFL